MNENIAKLGRDAPSDMVLLFETHPGWNQSAGPESVTTDRHKDEQYDGSNMAFKAGHVRFVRTSELDELKWTDY